MDEAHARDGGPTALSQIGAIEDLPVPTLALIHGQCYAGALETCLACDLIWAAEGSQIGQIEAVAGSITYAGGTQRIASRIGVDAPRRWCLQPLSCLQRFSRRGASSTALFRRAVSPRRAALSLRPWQTGLLALTPWPSECSTPGARAELPPPTP